MHFLSFPNVKNLLIYWDACCRHFGPVLALCIRSGSLAPEKLNGGFLYYAVFSAIATLTLLRMSGVSKAAWRFFSFPDAVDAFSSIGFGVIVAIAAGFASNTLESLPRSVPVVQVACNLQPIRERGCFLSEQLTICVRKKPPDKRASDRLQSNFISLRAGG